MERNNSTATVAFKRTWTPKEDATILQLVELHGASNWSLIADGLINRTGKQCRERYHNHLQPDVKKGEWTEAEDAKIVELQKLFGNQWAKIAKELPGRTDNAVKNRWHAAMRSHCKTSQAAASSSSSSSSGRQQVPRLPLVPATIDEIVRKYSPRFETDMNMAGSLDLNQLSHSHHMHSHASLSARTVDYSGEDSPRVSPRLQHNCAAVPTTATGTVPSILSVLRIPIASSAPGNNSSDSDSDSNSDVLSEEDLESLAFLVNGGALEDDEDSCTDSGSEVEGDAFSATCSSITCSGMTTHLQLDRWAQLDTVGVGLRTRSNSHSSSCGGSSGYDGDSTCSDEDVADDATTAVTFPLSLDTNSTSTLDLGGVDLFEQLEISPRAELAGARFGNVQNKQSRRKNGTKRPKAAAAAAAPSAYLRQCTASSGFSPVTSPDYKKKRAGSVLSSLSAAAAPASASASAADMMMFDVADFSLTPAETDQFQGLGLDGDAALYAQDMF